MPCPPAPGAFKAEQLRSMLVKAASTAAPLRLAGRRVLLVDHTGYPRPAARTVAERERYHGPNNSRPVGHRYSWLSQVVDPDTAWTSPLDVQRISATNTPPGTAHEQVERVAVHSEEPLLVVGDREYEYGVNEVPRGAARGREGPAICQRHGSTGWCACVRTWSSICPLQLGSPTKRVHRASTGHGCN